MGRFDSGSTYTPDLYVPFSFLKFRPADTCVVQIVKNRQTKCNGLSLALFMFAILGNVSLSLTRVIPST